MNGPSLGSRCTGPAHLRALRQARDAAEQEDGRLQRPEERARACKEKIADGAIGKVEALVGVAHKRGVEVHQERADDVLVGLAHAVPQRAVALHD
eukprot:32856-Chlamydomonas_euryale.AAC.1